MTERDTRIGFIGAGNMGYAMIGCLLDAGHAPGLINVSDSDQKQRGRAQGLHADLRVTDDNAAVLEACEVLVLAVKPQVLASVTEKMSGAARPEDQLIMSVAAGTTLDTLQALFEDTSAVVRIMPNQPALVGAAMSVLIATPTTSDHQRELAEYVAEAVGHTVWIDDEQMMDAVTAISGSGPAYFYLLAEIVESCAKEMGMSPELARTLTRQTLFGAGKTVFESDLSLAELRQSVTSKGGTTAAAIEVLERAGIRDIVREALAAARERSIDLGKGTGPADTQRNI